MIVYTTHYCLPPGIYSVYIVAGERLLRNKLKTYRHGRVILSMRISKRKEYKSRCVRVYVYVCTDEGDTADFLPIACGYLSEGVSVIRLAEHLCSVQLHRTDIKKIH